LISLMGAFTQASASVLLNAKERPVMKVVRMLRNYIAAWTDDALIGFFFAQLICELERAPHIAYLQDSRSVETFSPFGLLHYFVELLPASLRQYRWDSVYRRRSSLASTALSTVAQLLPFSFSFVHA